MSNDYLETNTENKNIIRGWLIVFGIILILSFGIKLLNLVIYFRSFYTPDFWKMLEQGGYTIKNTLRQTFYRVLITNSIMIIFQLIVIINYFIKSRNTPKLIIIFQTIYLIALISNNVYNFLFTEKIAIFINNMPWPYSIIQIIYSFIVILYFSRSKCVEDTFM